MNYENIFRLQDMKFTFEQAKAMDARGIAFNDHDAIEEFEEEQEALSEHLADLEARGFFYGTDDPFVIDRIEQQNAFDDRYEMYCNEY